MLEMNGGRSRLPRTPLEAFNHYTPAMVLPDADPAYLSALDKDITAVVVARSRRSVRLEHTSLYSVLVSQGREFLVEQCDEQGLGQDIVGGRLR